MQKVGSDREVELQYVYSITECCVLRFGVWRHGRGGTSMVGYGAGRGGKGIGGGRSVVASGARIMRTGGKHMPPPCRETSASACK